MGKRDGVHDDWSLDTVMECDLVRVPTLGVARNRLH